MYLIPPYPLRWSAEGKTFFDLFELHGVEKNDGAAQYVTSWDEAFADGLLEAHDTHAILRVGGRGSHLYKRKSVKLYSKAKASTFLAALKFSHTPYGCGLWPSFWTLGERPRRFE